MAGNQEKNKHDGPDGFGDPFHFFFYPFVVYVSSRATLE
jgi:hypothetical protein